MKGCWRSLFILIALTGLVAVVAGLAVAVPERAMAGPREDLLAQRQKVEQAAAAVAQARRDGSGRQETARRMAIYRELSEQLELLEQHQASSGNALNSARARAQHALSEALASGKKAPEARATLASWLGPLDARLEVLAQAVEGVKAVDAPDLARDILLDVADQCQAVALCAAYDASLEEELSAQLRLRAGSVVRAGVVGQEGSMNAAVEARRMEAEAAAADTRRVNAQQAHARAELIQAAVAKQLELSP